MFEAADAICGDSLDKIWHDDVALVQLANKRRLSLLTSPSQSNFRVFALLLVTSPAGRQILEGTNSEPCYIGGSICAERSALTKLRFIASCTLEKVVVVSDFEEPISPGALCREYIASTGHPSTIIVMGNESGDKITHSLIDELFPFPSIYRLQNRKDIIKFGESFSAKLLSDASLSLPGDSVERLRKLALSYVENDLGNNLHPLRIASAVLFSDNSTSVAWQLKGAEYGCTLDSVSQLVGIIARGILDRSKALPFGEFCLECQGPLSPGGLPSKSSAGVTAKLIVSVDQYGIMHAPHGQARALLIEHNCSDVMIAVHDDSGVLHMVPASELLPPPTGATLLTHDDFF